MKSEVHGAIFQLERNCWRISQADHAALLVDCANYYRALHRSICQARHSVFILGWEIDSSTRLLRGEDESKSRIPSAAAEFLAWKAEQNPELQIYLLRWDSSVFMATQRELMTEMAWTNPTPENVHICMDGTSPFTASHHQKIVLIDDELVFTGGMDIARQRWDENEHRIIEPERVDANGPYGPYHDVQIALDGPVVSAFSELVRWRWKRAAGYEAVGQRNRPSLPGENSAFPPANDFSASFEKIPCAVARTIPQMEDTNEIHECRQMYLDLISTAERFIYIENQFVTAGEVARALNQRMKLRPRLQVLILSSFGPQGLFEREGMWAGRIDFKEIVEAGLGPRRVRMVYPSILDSSGKIHYKRIHSKVFIVDDRYLVVASSNLNRRSFHFDSECDVVLQASNRAHSESILRIRHDLLAEHTGKSSEELRRIFENRDPLEAIVASPEPGHYSLQDMNDYQFTDRSLKPVALSLADPEKPLIVMDAPVNNPRRSTVVKVGLAILAVSALIGLWKTSSIHLSPDELKLFLEKSRHSPRAFPIVCLVYVVGGFVLFPVTLLSLIVAATFGPLWGPIYALTGALLSAALMFWIGHRLGLRGLRKLAGDRIRKIDARFREAGILGVATLRLIPLAPFTLVNMAAGISSVRFSDFIIGTFLGFLPAYIAKGFVGDSLVQIFLHPTRANLTYMISGLTLWLAIAYGTHRFVLRWRERSPS